MTRSRSRLAVFAAFLSLLGFFTAAAQEPSRPGILIDTDFCAEIDDSFALLLAFASDEVEVRGITTVGDDTQQKAMAICRFLTMTGRRHVPVAAGAKPQPERKITDLFKYYYHPDPLFDRTKKPEKQTAVEFLASRLKGAKKTKIVAIGPLTNIAALLKAQPEAKNGIEQIILMEKNIKLDIPAAKEVFASGAPLFVISEKASEKLSLDVAELKSIFGPATPLTRQVESMFQMSNRESAPLAEAVAVAKVLPIRGGSMKMAVALKPQLSDEGNTETGKGLQVLMGIVVDPDFRAWYTERIANTVKPAARPSKPVEPGLFPHRVHVCEDFDLDIEKFWWMSGREETSNVPAGSKRACRSVLTHDFDDLLMPSREMYSAVVFNPVPGPPMGKNTRLRFRYFLKGTDTIRVQLYSLSRGYHRHLVVAGLPQNKWAEATVDFTQARRPDGTGGPLEEGERIDDIQFYLDGNAEIVVDDVILYDAAAEGEKRPFPKKLIFTAWFDSGKQGKEWPGDFEIVPDAGNFWKGAKSIPHPMNGFPWLRIGMRGSRPLPEKTRLTFRYKFTGEGPKVGLALVNSTTSQAKFADLKSPKPGEWTEATLDFDTKDLGSADEILFSVPKDCELLVDDLLLYDP